MSPCTPVPVAPLCSCAIRPLQQLMYVRALRVPSSPTLCHAMQRPLQVFVLLFWMGFQVGGTWLQLRITNQQQQTDYLTTKMGC